MKLTSKAKPGLQGQIIERIRDRLKELGMTQKDLAKKLNISQPFVSNLLKEKDKLTLEMIVKIEVALSFQIIYVVESEFSSE